MANTLASYGSDSPADSGLAGVFDNLHSGVNRESALEGVRLGVLMNAVGRRSYGPLLLLLGLIAVSPLTILPGTTSVVASIILLLAAQMALGFERPWLPRAMLNMRVPRGALFACLDRARPTVDRIDGAWLRPRLTFMTAPPFVFLVALCVVAAALITFPLSLVPIAPLAPGLAVVLFGVGMTARDGLWLSLGMLCVVAAFFVAGPIIL